MKSVYPFFYPAAKKCKLSSHRHSYEHEGNKATLTKEASKVCREASAPTHDTRSMSELVRPSCSEVERCVHTAVKSVDSQEQVTEHYSSMAASCQSCYDPLSQEPLFRSVSELGRRWCKFYRRCYHRERYRNFNFTIVSYNVLADGLLQSNSHLYTGTEEWLKSWEYRKRNLLQELLFYDADILCLQEIEEHHYQDWFEPRLKEQGYIGVYKKRTGNKKDGCATFFKKSKFTLVKTKLVSFKVPGVGLMDRDNVAVVTLLKPGPTGQTARVAHPSHTCLCIGNTHLLFNTKRGDIKLAQLAYLFAEIDEVARISPHGADNPLYHPIICCGDFNSTPFSPIYDFVTRGYLDYNGMHRDNFSGQNHFRYHYPFWQAATNNLIPWELGITTSSCKRNNVEVSCTSESWNAKEMAEKRYPSVLMENSGPGSEPCSCTLHDVPRQKTYSNSSKTTSQSTENENTQQALPGIVEEFNACTTQHHKLNFFSVYKHSGRTRRREVTTFHDRVCTTVDYIFFSPGEQWNCRKCHTTHGSLQPTGILGLLTEEEIWLLEGLPNRYLSSDHLALVASFLLHI